MVLRSNHFSREVIDEERQSDRGMLQQVSIDGPHPHKSHLCRREPGARSDATYRYHRLLHYQLDADGSGEAVRRQGQFEEAERVPQGPGFTDQEPVGYAIKGLDQVQQGLGIFNGDAQRRRQFCRGTLFPGGNVCSFGFACKKVRPGILLLPFSRSLSSGSHPKPWEEGH